MQYYSGEAPTKAEFQRAVTTRAEFDRVFRQLINHEKTRSNFEINKHQKQGTLYNVCKLG